jgi:hypothetical protein
MIVTKKWRTNHHMMASITKILINYCQCIDAGRRPTPDAVTAPPPSTGCRPTADVGRRRSTLLGSRRSGLDPAAAVFDRLLHKCTSRYGTKIF